MRNSASKFMKDNFMNLLVEFLIVGLQFTSTKGKLLDMIDSFPCLLKRDKFPVHRINGNKSPSFCTIYEDLQK